MTAKESLRDQFAMAALPALIALDEDRSSTMIAAQAYTIADRMIYGRGRGREQDTTDPLPVYPWYEAPDWAKYAATMPRGAIWWIPVYPWHEAPDWAKYAATMPSGATWWTAMPPSPLRSQAHKWLSDGRSQKISDGTGRCRDWHASVQPRPTEQE